MVNYFVNIQNKANLRDKKEVSRVWTRFVCLNLLLLLVLTGTVYADFDFESYAISVAEGFKYIPDGSLLYLRLDGTPFDQAFVANDVVNVQFTQGYKK